VDLAVNSRERIIVLLLVAVLGFSAFTRFVSAPIAKQIASYQAQINKSASQLKELSGNQKPVQDLEGRIEALRSENKELEAKAKEMEKSLPSRGNVSQLIAEFTRLAQNVKLESVKQTIAKEEGFARLFLEVKFNATYAEAIKYVSAVESISPFLRIDEMEISEPKGKAAELGGTPMRVVVSCLLGEGEEGEQVLKATTPAEGAPMTRDILASRAKPASELRDTEYRIEGITYDPKNSTAIINGDVYQVGSEIGDYKVKTILQDGVVLTDGVEDHLLKVKR
jgi:Tfp pilus assembly protein PilO